MLGFVLRNSKFFRNPITKISVFNAYVRSNVEYCSVVWSPSYKVHQLRIERIQRRFTAHLTFAAGLHKQSLSYGEKLKYFKIDSLLTRRQLRDMTFLYKVLRNGLDCSAFLSAISFRVPRRVPRQAALSGLLHQPLARTNLKQSSTLSRISKMYNTLVPEVDIFNTSLHSFRSIVLRLLRNRNCV